MYPILFIHIYRITEYLVVLVSAWLNRTIHAYEADPRLLVLISLASDAEWMEGNFIIHNVATPH